MERSHQNVSLSSSMRSKNLMVRKHAGASRRHSPVGDGERESESRWRWVFGEADPRLDGDVPAEGDRRAYVALAWLLMPGAARVAGRIRRLADEIDEVVAGQLWIHICDHDPEVDKVRRQEDSRPRL
jgi:hypothetical protein